MARVKQRQAVHGEGARGLRGVWSVTWHAGPGLTQVCTLLSVILLDSEKQIYNQSLRKENRPPVVNSAARPILCWGPGHWDASSLGDGQLPEAQHGSVCQHQTKANVSEFTQIRILCKELSASKILITANIYPLAD